MMRRPMVVSPTVLVALAGLVAASGCAGNAAQARTGTTPSASVDVGLQHVVGLGVRRLGRDFSCAVTPSGGPRMVVYVRSSAHVSAGRRLLKAAAVRGGVVKIGFAHRDEVDLRRIAGAIHHSQPTSTGGTGIQITRTTAEATSCPRVLIQLASADDVPANVTRWAGQQVKRYGSDRVLVRNDLAGPGPA